MGWEDVLKRGRVPKKPTKEVVDTGFKTTYERNTEPLSREEELDRLRESSDRESIKNRKRLAIAEKERLERLELPPESVFWSDEEWEKHRDKKSKKIKEAREASREIRRQKDAGTHRKRKGQQRNRNPEPPKKETRGERKKRIEAQKKRKAKEEDYARRDAARDARNRRRGL